jgi:hypothetical protein
MAVESVVDDVVHRKQVVDDSVCVRNICLRQKPAASLIKVLKMGY